MRKRLNGITADMLMPSKTSTENNIDMSTNAQQNMIIINEPS